MTGKPTRRGFGKIVIGLGVAGLTTAGASAAGEEPEDADYYVATDGNDSNPGTKSEPFGSVKKATEEMSAGDLTYVRGGTYEMDDILGIWGKSGTESNPIRLEGYPGERPVLKWGGGTSNWEAAGGIRIANSSYWEIRNLEIRDSPYKGINIYGDSEAHNNVIEDVEVHHNNLPGVHIAGNAKHNVLRNVVSHDNYDFQSDGGNADGIQITGGEATDNRVIKCTSYANSDDGFDFWEATDNRIYRSIACDNGRDEGNGNGFKLGGGDNSGRQEVVRCIAYQNRARGFDHNGANETITLYNNTSWNNGGQNYRFSGSHVLKNNISHKGSASLDGSVTDEANSWNMGISDPMFTSIDDSTDEFLVPTEDSPVVDAGVVVEVEYEGEHPDLGAFETSASATDTETSTSTETASETTHVITIDGSDDDEYTEYEFTVSGTLSKSTADGATFNSDDIIEGSTATGDVKGGKDSYEFTGELDSFTFRNDASCPVYVDENQIDLGGSDSTETSEDTTTQTSTEDDSTAEWNVITLAGSETDDYVEYTFTVSGELHKSTENGASINDSDTISENTAEGELWGGKDSYTFLGSLETFEWVENSGQVYLNGEEITPGDASMTSHTLVVDGTDAEATEYEFSLSQGSKLRRFTGSLDSDDSITGMKIVGDVSGDTDMYEFVGDIVDWSFTKGEATILLDGKEVSPGDF